MGGGSSQKRCGWTNANSRQRVATTAITGGGNGGGGEKRAGAKNTGLCERTKRKRETKKKKEKMDLILLAKGPEPKTGLTVVN